MSRGDSAYAAQHPHGIQGAQEVAAPKTAEQLIADLTIRVEELEAKEALRSTPATEAPVSA